MEQEIMYKKIQIKDFSEENIIKNWKQGLSIKTLSEMYVNYLKHICNKKITKREAEIYVTKTIYDYQMRGWK